MKKLLLFELMNTVKGKPKLIRKLKIFAAVGAFGILLTGSLVIWAGISAFGYVTNKAKEVIQSPQAGLNIENIKSEIQNLSVSPSIHCWDKAQSLMTMEPWLQKPAMENLNNLIATCFDKKTNQSNPREKGVPSDTYQI